MTVQNYAKIPRFIQTPMEKMFEKEEMVYDESEVVDGDENEDEEEEI